MGGSYLDHCIFKLQAFTLGMRVDLLSLSFSFSPLLLLLWSQRVQRLAVAFPLLVCLEQLPVSF